MKSELPQSLFISCLPRKAADTSRPSSHPQLQAIRMNPVLWVYGNSVSQPLSYMQHERGIILLRSLVRAQALVVMRLSTLLVFAPSSFPHQLLYPTRGSILSQLNS